MTRHFRRAHLKLNYITRAIAVAHRIRASTCGLIFETCMCCYRSVRVIIARYNWRYVTLSRLHRYYIDDVYYRRKLKVRQRGHVFDPSFSRTEYNITIFQNVFANIQRFRYAFTVHHVLRALSTRKTSIRVSRVDARCPPLHVRAPIWPTLRLFKLFQTLCFSHLAVCVSRESTQFENKYIYIFFSNSERHTCSHITRIISYIKIIRRE